MPAPSAPRPAIRTTQGPSLNHGSLFPSSWPIAAKLFGAMIIASLLPLSVALWWTASQSRHELERAARRNMELHAAAAAERLDQLIGDTARLASSLAKDERTVMLCTAAAAARPDAHPLADPMGHRLRVAVETNPDLASAFIIDARGIGLASTNPRNFGQDLSFREYCRDALAGRAHVSEFLVGKTSGEAGVYFSSPVRADDTGGGVVGAAVIKLRGERVQEIIASVRIGHLGHLMLADHHGVILAHPLAYLHFRSLGPLTDGQQQAIDPQASYGLDRIAPVDAAGLLPIARGSHERPRGSTSFASSDGAAETGHSAWVAGYARMSAREWTVFAVEPEAQFDEAGRYLWHRNLGATGVVAVFAAGLALWRSRAITRPVVDLHAAAERLAGGDFSARATPSSRDEIGRLAETFNSMVPRLEEAVELRHTMELATEIQQSLLPEHDPDLPALEIVGRCRYCDDTGGDYYDFIDTAPARGGGTLIALGDVAGHGLPAALLMASARAALRCAAAGGLPLPTMLDRVNHVLNSDRNFRFMTLVLLAIDPSRGTARWASAGHDPAIVLHHASNDFSELVGGSAPLGVEDDMVYAEYTRDGLGPGDVIVIGTDGIWEAVNPEGVMYGKQRLRDVVRENAHAPVAAIADAIEADLRRFRDTAPQRDDITFVVIRIEPPRQENAE
ncbi:MAG: SpoIIE family protein phosphatase [Phycisphaeraceae bacterium]|nr:SpoIIE family protein phosphatase [Phycisphaeraceae bacterium]